jgi:protein-histidine pros-kinase
LREKFPDYFYKEATLNPTNPRDRATDWESDVVNQFRAGAIQNEFITSREASTGTVLVLARPIKVNNVSCLECHSTPDKAPTEMIKLYGTANGFNWKMDDIIGAQVVSVPVSVPLRTAEETFRMLLTWLGGAFGCIVIAANLGVAIVAPPKT